jgi:hypothetical protein
MEHRTKSFLWGTVVGAALLLVAIIGLITYLYFKGTTVGEEKLARQQNAEAEQIQEFGTTCSNAVSEALVYLHKTLTPALNAYPEWRSNKEALTDLISGVGRQEEFLSHCATQAAIHDESSLKRSKQLMSASTGFSTINAFLNGLQINNCDQACQKDLVRRVEEASVEVEDALRGRKKRQPIIQSGR